MGREKPEGDDREKSGFQVRTGVVLHIGRPVVQADHHRSSGQWSSLPVHIAAMHSATCNDLFRLVGPIHQPAEPIGGRARAKRQGPNILTDYGKTTPGIACARGLDRGVDRDEKDHFADL